MAKDRVYTNLQEKADLILENDGENVYIFRNKLWALSVEIQETYRLLSMIEFPSKENMDEFVSEQVVDFGYTVTGGVMRDQIIVDFND